MKTTAAARRIVKARLPTFCVGVAILAVIELGLGESLANRIGQATLIRSEVCQPGNLCVADFMAAMR